MKTMFGRMFALTASLLLVSCLLMGLTFRMLFGTYMFREEQESLEQGAVTIAELAAAYDTSGELEHNWDFRIGLSVASDVTSSKSLFYDETGRVILCSCDALQCEMLERVIPADVMAQTKADGQFFERGTLQDTFDSTKLIVCIPVYSNSTGEELGGVVVMAEPARVDLVLSYTTNTLLVIGFFVLIIAITATSLWAQKETRPLKELARTAREFGHGNLRARALIGNTEEVDELAAAFNNMATSLEKTEIQRREFVANVSHELKTPMTTIAGYMDGMIDGTIPKEQHSRYMELVSGEVRRLSRLVRSMLEVSRIQDQGIPEEKKRKFDICETIGRTLLSFEQKINMKHLQVEVQMPDNGIGVWAEEDSITQVVYNLIDNAVKFCEREGCLFLQVESDGMKATVSVANTGQTIPEGELPLVFDRFHKTDKSRSVDREGVGLGLYIVRTIVVTHGEDISVTSRDGVTRFSFTLPVK